MWPKTIAGQPVQVTVLDDASDPAPRCATSASWSTRITSTWWSGRHHAGRARGPRCGGRRADADDHAGRLRRDRRAAGRRARTWAFKMAQSDRAMADVMTRHMANHGVKTVGFIGFADSYGDSWLNEFTLRGPAQDPRHCDRALQPHRRERHGPDIEADRGETRRDPDRGTPAVLPQRTLIERGYQPGLPDPRDRDTGIHQAGRQGCRRDAVPDPAGGRRAHAACRSSGPQAALAFVDAYEAKYGAGTVTQFAGDGGRLPAPRRRGRPRAEGRAARHAVFAAARAGTHGSSCRTSTRATRIMWDSTSARA